MNRFLSAALTVWQLVYRGHFLLLLTLISPEWIVRVSVAYGTQTKETLLVPGLYLLELIAPSPIMEFKTQQFLSVFGIFLDLLIAASNKGLAQVYTFCCQ